MEFNLRRKIWLALLIASIIFFAWAIPLTSYNQSPFYISLTGGIFVFVFTFLFISDVTSIYELTEKDPDNQKKSLNYAPWAIVPGIAFLFIFLFNFEARKKSVFANEGALTKGTIINGHSETSKRRGNTSTSYEVIVEFEDDRGTRYEFNQSLNSKEYDRLYNGATIDVKYWKKSPKVAKAILSDDDIKESLNIENRPLAFTDLSHIINISLRKDSLIKYLNSINYKWEQQGPDLFINRNRNCAIKVKEDTLVYLEYKNNFSNEEKDFEQSLNQKDFKKKWYEIKWFGVISLHKRPISNN